MSRRPPRIFEPGYYDRLREIEERHWWSRGMRRAMDALLAGSLAGRGPLRVIDIGCGTGVLLEHARRWPLAGTPIGIDVSAEAVRHVRDRDAGRVVRGDAAVLPFRSGRFDLALSVDVVQHLSPEGAARSVAESARLLRPGGTLYLRTNARCGHRRLRGVDPERYRRYGRGELVELAGSAGLEVVRSTHLNALPGAWGSLIERLRRPRRDPPGGPPLTIRPPSRWRARLDRLLDAETAVEAWLLQLGIDLPFGHSTALVARRPALDRPRGSE